MITFDQYDKRFKYRVAGLCIHENYVLLTKADHDDYWILPGGRVELFKDTRTAIQRELFGETGHRAQVEDLLFIIENYFHLDSTNYHEPAFIYRFSLKDPAILNNTWAHQTTEGDTRIELQWFEQDRLSKVHFQPAFLVPLMKDPPRTTQHVLARDPQERKADR